MLMTVANNSNSGEDIILLLDFYICLKLYHDWQKKVNK